MRSGSASLDHAERFCFNEESDHAEDYLVGQGLEIIEWLEKVTGKTYDEELLIDAAVNLRETMALWSEIMELNQAKPAPMDMKSMFTLSNLAVRAPFTKASVEFYKELRNEMIERVRDGIAAVANEKVRLLHENLPPWFALHIFRFIENTARSALPPSTSSFGAAGIGYPTAASGPRGIRPLPGCRARGPVKKRCAPWPTARCCPASMESVPS